MIVDLFTNTIVLHDISALQDRFEPKRGLGTKVDFKSVLRNLRRACVFTTFPFFFHICIYEYVYVYKWLCSQ